MNYTEMQTRVHAYLNREDLGSYIADWINTAKRNIERRYSLPYMKQTSTALTTVSGTATYTAPTRMKTVKQFWLHYGDTKHFLREVSDEKAEHFYYDVTPDNNLPIVYSITAIDENESKTITLIPTPDDAYTTKMLYWGFSADFSNGSDTNWLSVQAPEALIYGALLEAQPFMGADNRMQTWGGMYEKALDELKQYANQDLTHMDFRGV